MLLHFNDQLRELNTLYFIDPSWLCDVFAGCHRERKKPFREKRIHKEVGFNVDTVENPQIAGKIYSAGNFYFVITDGLQHVEIMTSSISSS